MISKNKKLKSLYDQIVQMFEQRPVWSKNAIMYHLKADRVELRSVLPGVAYYFTSGPFRCLWVKFGYDPRKDQSAVKYQTVDFRLRHSYVRSFNVQASSDLAHEDQKAEAMDTDGKIPEVGAFHKLPGNMKVIPSTTYPYLLFNPKHLSLHQAFRLSNPVGS